MQGSPYDGIDPSQWKNKTEELICAHPLSTEEIIEVVLESWNGIMETKIAGRLKIGVDSFPQPQIMGNFLHELIPVLLEEKYPGDWSRDKSRTDKDLVCLTDKNFSVEIKTSSSLNDIFGNASYGQENSSAESNKSKDGYYLTVNFEKFRQNDPAFKPQIKKIRFGWLDHSDWHSQRTSSGQRSRIKSDVRDKKLLLIYDRDRAGEVSLF